MRDVSRHMTSDPIGAFLDAIADAGLQPPNNVVFDGQIHRFGTNNKSADDAGWYVGHQRGHLAVGSFGCWRTGIQGKWSSLNGSSSPEDRAFQEQMMREQAEKVERERKERAADAAESATNLWLSLPRAPADHPYLVRKGVKPHGTRLYRGPMVIRDMKCDGAIVVPAHDDQGKIKTLEFIAEDGEKRFLAGGEKGGHFCMLGPDKNAPKVLIAEGFATAATLHEATGLPVAVAFDAGNLEKVAVALREYRLIICADNDRLTDGNPGVTKASAAAKAVNGELAIPPFGAFEDGSDWNDFAALRGTDAVRRALHRYVQTFLHPIDLADLAGRKAEEPRFIIPGWLPARAVTLLSSHGSAGKSQIAMVLGVCLAAGIPWMGIPVERQKVLIYSCEDERPVLEYRAQQACAALGVDMTDLVGWLHLADQTEAENIFYTDDSSPERRITAAYHAVSQYVAEFGIQVSIIDNASDVFAANEISRAAVKDFISKLKRLATINDGAVLLLGHASKDATKTPTTGQMYSGSTAWHNSVRSRWELALEKKERQEDGIWAPDDDPMDIPPDAGRILRCVKSNYGEEGQFRVWRWDAGYRILLPDPPKSRAELDAERHRADMTVLTAVARCNDEKPAGSCHVYATDKGRFTAASVLIEKGVRMRAADIRASLNRMLGNGLIEKSAYDKGGRNGIGYEFRVSDAGREVLEK